MTIRPTTGTKTRPARPVPGARRAWAPPHVGEGRGPAGHRLRWCDLPNQPVAHLVAHIAVSVVTEPAELEGICAVYAQASTLSAPGLDRVAFAEVLGACGARLDVRADDDGIDVQLSAPEWHLDRLVPLVADVLAAPTLGDDVVEQAIEQVRGQLLQEQGDPAAEVWLGMRRAYYEADDRRSRAVEGSLDSLGRITPDLVRSFGEQTALGADVAVVLAGRLGDRDPEELLGRVVQGLPEPSNAAAGQDRPPRRRPGRVVMHRDGVPQTQVALAWAAPGPASSGRAATAVLSHHLGGDFTSLVNTVMRAEHGLTYGMHTSLIGHGTGSRMVVGGAVQADRTAVALTVLDDMLDGVASRGVPDDTVREIGSVLQNKAPARWADAGSAASTVVGHLQAGLPANQEARWLAALSAVGPAEVHSAVDQVLGAPRATALCGPRDLVPSREGDE